MTVSSYRYGVPAHSFKIEFPRLNVVVFFSFHTKEPLQMFLSLNHTVCEGFRSILIVTLSFISSLISRPLPSLSVMSHQSPFLFILPRRFCGGDGMSIVPNSIRKSDHRDAGGAFDLHSVFSFITESRHSVCLKIMKLNLPPSPLQA